MELTEIKSLSELEDFMSSCKQRIYEERVLARAHELNIPIFGPYSDGGYSLKCTGCGGHVTWMHISEINRENVHQYIDHKCEDCRNYKPPFQKKTTKKP